MNIEQIGSDRLKVFLNAVDLDKYALDYMSISKDSPGTKSMLRDILHRARQLSGFSLKNAKLFIEVVPGKNDGCVLYLTKLIQTAEYRLHTGENKLPADGCPYSSQPDAAGDAEKAHSGYILSCGSLEDTIGAINCFGSFPDVPLMSSSLYNHEESYQLAFSPVRFGLDQKRLSALIASLSEYGEMGKSSPLKEAMLAEHGKAILNERAVENFMLYFH